LGNDSLEHVEMMVESAHAYLQSVMKFLESQLSFLSEKLNDLSSVRVAEGRVEFRNISAWFL
jgi:hypothetical protein